MKAKRIAGLLLTLSLTVTTAGTTVLPTFAQAPDGSIVVTEEKLASPKAVTPEDGEESSLTDAASYAKASSDFTSDWENLSHINEDWEPTASSGQDGGGWGNWSQEVGSEHWVQYDWDAAITTSQMQIYWYDDGGGLQVPATLKIQYQDAEGNWVDANMTTDYANAQAKDQYNVIEFEEITAKSIRLLMTVRDGAAGMGIYRWKVMSDISGEFILNNDKEALTLPEKVSSDFYLTPTSKSGYAVTWASDNDAVKVQDNYGVVTRGTEDVNVTLTATITDGETTVSKEFQVVVAKTTRTSTVSSVDFTKVHINDKFWSARQKKFICDVIPVGIEKVETATGGIPNLKNAALKNAGKEAGKYQGTVYFLDSDPYKMIEAMSYALQIEANGDAEIIKAQDNIKEKLAEWIPYIQGAQEEDGYLDTYFTLDLSDETLACFPEDATREKFYDFSRHEMYVAGHFYEAAVAHYRATKDKSLLDVAVKNADLICATFGNEEGKKKAVPGHEEIELALIKLAAACQETGEESYMEKSSDYIRMAKYFLDTRGDTEGRYGKNGYTGHFGDEYDQDHLPVTEQTEAVGHAVRCMYLYTGMADVALLEDTDIYDNALLSLWEDITVKKSYVTGGIGSSAANEGFGEPYELPNESAYCETCANIGSVMWNTRMNLLYGDSKYADVMERTLYNSVISCVNFDGDKFFYGNPMSSSGGSGRSEWFGCACCPPNLMRIVESLGSYVYTQDQNVLTLNLYIGNDATLQLDNQEVQMNLATEMPWNGNSTITVTKADKANFSLRLRVPEWATGANKISVNGTEVNVSERDANGYVVVTREFNTGDKIEIDFPMSIEKTHTVDEVKNNIGFTAIKRGPIVYAAEGIDNNFKLTRAWMPKESELTATWSDNLMNDNNDPFGIKSGYKITGAGKVLDQGKEKDINWTLIPYYAWNNRDYGEMRVYISEVVPTIRLADDAKVSCSYQYGNSITNINDGSNGSFWNGWGETTVSDTAWIMYEFDKKLELTGSTINWYDDGGGVVVPEKITFEYYDDSTGTWKEVVKTGDDWVYLNKTDNVYNFEKIVTSKIKLVITNSTVNGSKVATAINEWQLIGKEYVEGTEPGDNTNPGGNETKVDFSALKATIAKAKKLKAADYTTASFKNLKTALSSAEKVAANAKATQAQVDKENTNLNKAIKGLVKLKVVSTKKATLGVKEKYSVAAKGYTYTTSNKKVATVTKKGVVKAKKTGKAVIKATNKAGKVKVYNITVKKAPKKIVKVTPAKKTLKKGKKVTLKVTLPKGSAGSCTFKSSNKKVATVSAKGVVKAKKKGIAKITVKTYNGKKKTVTITVK